MPAEFPELITASSKATALGVSDAEVKKAIAELGFAPALRKGCCTHYTAEGLKRVETLLK